MKDLFWLYTHSWVLESNTSEFFVLWTEDRVLTLAPSILSRMKTNPTHHTDTSTDQPCIGNKALIDSIGRGRSIDRCSIGGMKWGDFALRLNNSNWCQRVQWDVNSCSILCHRGPETEEEERTVCEWIERARVFLQERSTWSILYEKGNDAIN